MYVLYTGYYWISENPIVSQKKNHMSTASTSTTDQTSTANSPLTNGSAISLHVGTKDVWRYRRAILLCIWMPAVSYALKLC